MKGGRVAKKSSPKGAGGGSSTGGKSEGRDSWCFVITVKPGQSREFLRRESPDGKDPVWVVGVRVPAREGLANEAVVVALAKFLEVAPSSVTILRGQSSRTKRIEVAGIGAALGEARLTAVSS